MSGDPCDNLFPRSTAMLIASNSGQPNLLRSSVSWLLTKGASRMKQCASGDRTEEHFAAVSSTQLQWCWTLHTLLCSVAAPCSAMTDEGSRTERNEGSPGKKAGEMQTGILSRR